MLSCWLLIWNIIIMLGKHLWCFCSTKGSWSITDIGYYSNVFWHLWIWSRGYHTHSFLTQSNYIMLPLHLVMVSILMYYWILSFNIWDFKNINVWDELVVFFNCALSSLLSALYWFYKTIKKLFLSFYYVLAI